MARCAEGQAARGGRVESRRVHQGASATAPRLGCSFLPGQEWAGSRRPLPTCDDVRRGRAPRAAAPGVPAGGQLRGPRDVELWPGDAHPLERV
jgi:hypothetical protein